MKTATKIQLILIIFALSFFVAQAKAQSCSTCTTGPCLNLAWNKSYNGSQSDKDYGRAITTDVNGNSYVTGYATVGVDLSGNKNCSIVTIKYNSSGVQQWAQVTGNANNSGTDDSEKGNAIALDGHGNVWVAAIMQNGTTNKYDMTLIEYTNSGSIHSGGYPKYYAETSTGYDFTEAVCLVVKDSTHVYIGGKSTTNANYYGKVLMNNPSGGWYWAYTFNGSNLTSSPEAEAFDMKINSAGTYLYVTGCVNNGTAGGDVYLAKVNASTTGGTASWTQSYNFAGGISNNDLSYALYLDSGENGYLAGKTDKTSQGTNAFVIKYNSSGTQQWVSTYNYNNLEDAYVDIGGLGADSHGFELVYATGYRTGSSTKRNDDYITGAYKTTNGNLTADWTQNPKIFDGTGVGGSGGEAIYTDHAYALEYDATNHKVFVTGTSCDTLCPSGGPNLNITTLRYNGATGAQEWKGSFDYGTDNINSKDEGITKNMLVLEHDLSCTGMDAFVTGDCYVSLSNLLDYITIKYSVACIPGPPPRMMNPGLDTGGATFFPNPFSTIATLKIGGADVVDANLILFDVTGKVVREDHLINSNIIEIERGDLEEGIYFYQLANPSGIITSGKFIIVEL